jgi:hypothetical protein
MSLASAFRRCLETLDVIGIRKLWARIAPGAPGPGSNEEAEIALHLARTASAALPDKLRIYSHDFLMARGLPSRLPNELRRLSQWVEPRVVDAVGISVRSMSGSVSRGMLAKAIERAMSKAVLECYGDGVTDPEKIKKRMMEARKRLLRGA